MTLGPLCVTFSTYDSFYFYDANRNYIMKVSEKVFALLSTCLLGENFYGDAAKIEDVDFNKFYSKANKLGFFKPNRIKQIKHPATDYIEKYLQHGMSSLCIQVTQGCNLRCEYCPFSGNYYSVRKHSAKRMTWDLAKRSLDYLLQHSNNSPELKIAFFGGEPLLEINLIKKCVDYLKKNVVEKKVSYDLTTNGTLLSNDIMDFLADNQFQILLSFDGPVEIHNRSRRFLDDTGSFEIVLDNIKKFKLRHPEYCSKKVAINSVVSYHDSATYLNSYFSTEPIFQGFEVHAAGLLDMSLKDNSVMKHSQIFNITNRFENLKIIFDRLGIYKNGDHQGIPSVFSDQYRHTCNMAEQLSVIRDVLPDEYHPGGPCMPGIKKFFVNADGCFYPCERVNEQASFLCIGTIDTGIDIGKVKDILNSAKLTEDECKDCWAVQYCSSCAANSERDGKSCKEIRLSHCDSIKSNVINYFRYICMYKEFGYDFDLGLCSHFKEKR